MSTNQTNFPPVSNLEEWEVRGEVGVGMGTGKEVGMDKKKKNRKSSG